MSACLDHRPKLDTDDEPEVAFSRIPDYESNMWNEIQ
jgi:hypothetical protein